MDVSLPFAVTSGFGNKMGVTWGGVATGVSVAGLQQISGRTRVIFRYLKKQHSVNLGKVCPQEAEAKAGAIDLLLMRLEQG